MKDKTCFDTMNAISFGKCMSDFQNKGCSSGTQSEHWMGEKTETKMKQNKGFGTVKSKNKW